MVRSIERSLIVALALAACTARPAQVPTAFSPSELTLDLGEVPVGATQQRALTLSIRGARPMELSLDEATVPDGFSVKLGSSSIAPGTDQAATLTFAPRNPGAVSGTIVLHAGSATMQLHVSGLGFVLEVEANPTVLDFGGVRVGSSGQLPLQLRNPTARVETVHLTTDARFAASPDVVSLAPGASTTVEVSFTPKERGPVEAPLLLSPCSTCSGDIRTMKGSGMVEDFTLVPERLDFGAQSMGSTTCKDVLVENSGDLPIQFASATPDPYFTQSGIFDLQIGDLLSGAPMPAGASASLTICFTPKAFSKVYDGKVSFSTADNIPRTLAVHGVAGLPALATDPADLDVGATTPGVPITLRVALKNGGTDGPLVIGQVKLDGSDPALTLQHPDGDPSGSDVNAAPAWVEITLKGDVGKHQANLVVAIQGGDPVTLPVRGYVVDGEPCEVSAPPEMDFGLINFSRTYISALRIGNPGTAACYVWGFSVDPPDAGVAFIDAPQEPVAIDPGGFLDVNVSYTPMETSPKGAILRFHHLGSSVPNEVRVPGFASQIALDLTPNPIDFGTVQVGFLMHLQVSLINNSPRLLKVGGNSPPGTPNGDIAFSSDSSVTFAASGIPDGPYTIPGYGRMTFTVTFLATAPGTYQGTLELWLTDAAAPTLVPLLGTATAPACTTPPCSDFEVTCPDPVSGYLGTSYDFTGTVYDAKSSVLSCNWQLKDWPPGSTAKVASEDACKASLRPDVIGTYTLQLTSTDDLGNSSSCETLLKASEYGGLTVQTSWDSPDDLDLHLFHPDGGDPSLRKPWFNDTYDCYYGNDHPYWDSSGRGDDPYLVADDQSGVGPEKINLPLPSTEHGYVVAVHWFADMHGTKSETATTRISCNGTKVAEVQTVLTDVFEAAVVGTVTWSSDGTCSFTPSDATLHVVP